MQVRFAAAVCLGYMTHNKTAARSLLVLCRNTPGLFEVFMENIGKNPKISQTFVEDVRCAKTVGFPCLRSDYLENSCERREAASADASFNFSLCFMF